MSFTSLLVQTVAVIHPAWVEDRYGNAVADWTNATTATVKGWISQRDSTEPTPDRDEVASDWRLFVLPEVAIAASDRVVWEGSTFEVIGLPLPAWTPRGLHHREAQLRLVEG